MSPSYPERAAAQVGYASARLLCCPADTLGEVGVSISRQPCCARLRAPCSGPATGRMRRRGRCCSCPGRHGHSMHPAPPGWLRLQEPLRIPAQKALRLRCRAGEKRVVKRTSIGSPSKLKQNNGFAARPWFAGNYPHLAHNGFRRCGLDNCFASFDETWAQTGRAERDARPAGFLAFLPDLVSRSNGRIRNFRPDPAASSPLFTRLNA